MPSLIQGSRASPARLAMALKSSNPPPRAAPRPTKCPIYPPDKEDAAPGITPLKLEMIQNQRQDGTK